MENKRSSFSSSLGFVLAAAGSAVGLGNIWRFPYLAAKDGGGLFLVIYIVLALTFGFTLLTTEIAIGRKTKQSPLTAYKMVHPNKNKFKLMVLSGFNIVSKKTLLCLFVLLPNEKENTFKALFKILKENYHFNPRNIMCDFSLGQIKEVKEIYPYTNSMLFFSLFQSFLESFNEEYN